MYRYEDGEFILRRVVFVFDFIWFENFFEIFGIVIFIFFDDEVFCFLKEYELILEEVLFFNLLYFN